MAVQGLTWQELLDSVARRLGEPDLFDTSRTSEQQTPYFDGQEIERFLYRVSLTKLRALDDEECDSAVVMVTSTEDAAGSTVPLNAYAIAGAGVNQTMSGNFTLADEIQPATYYQLYSVPAAVQAYYTCVAGQLIANGVQVRVVYRVEPTLTQFRNDEIAIPAEYDEWRIDQTHKLALVQDFLPAGRM